MEHELLMDGLCAAVATEGQLGKFAREEREREGWMDGWGRNGTERNSSEADIAPRFSCVTANLSI